MKLPTSPLAAALLVLLLGACDKPAETATPAPPTTKPQPTPRGTPQAAAARQGLPAPSCPARADATVTGPDIVGLRLGMKAADALNAVRCAHGDAVLTFSDRWIQQLNTHGLKLGSQSFEARIGDTSPCSHKSFSDMQKCGAGGLVWNHVAELIHVATPGAPGKEVVQGVWRTQRFKEGAMPPMQAVLQALQDKYGPPQDRQESTGQVFLYWASDAQGHKLAPGSRALADCRGAQARPDAAQRWGEGCGLTLAAHLVSPRNNPQLALEVHVGLLHQQQLFNFGQALQAELTALDQARRQKELDQARGATGAVKL